MRYGRSDGAFPTLLRREPHRSLSMSASISACVRVPEYSGAYVPDLARYAKRIRLARRRGNRETLHVSSQKGGNGA